MTTTFYVHIVGNSKVNLWGMSGRTRLERMLRAIKTVTIVENLSQLAETDSVLLLRADYLFDARVIEALIALDKQMVLVTSAGEVPVAIRTSGKVAGTMREVLGETGGA